MDEKKGWSQGKGDGCLVQAYREFLGKKKIMTWQCIDVFMEHPKGGRATAAVSGECLSGLHLFCHLLQI